MVVPLLGLHEQVLPRVSRPNRYIAPFSVPGNAEGRICLLYPGSYRHALAHPAFRTLLDTLREGGPQVAVDVSFCPEEDLDALLSAEDLSLFGLASRLPLSAFDLVLVYASEAFEIPTALRMLKRGGVSSDLPEGPQVFLCGPLSLWGASFGSFFDGILAGDPEAFCEEILRGSLKEAEGVWTSSTPHAVEARWLSRVPSPSDRPLIPLCDLKPGGVPLEVARPRGVSDPYYVPPVLYRDGENAVRATERLFEETGFAQVIWGGTQACTHPELTGSLERLHSRGFSSHQTARVDWVHAGHLTPGLARELNKSRCGNLRFLPMAVSENLRREGGSALSAESLGRALQLAARGGWQYVELPVLIGVPGEAKADIQEFESLLESFVHSSMRKTIPKLRITLEPYVPKPQTPGEKAPFMEAEAFGSWALGLRERYKKGSRIKIAEGDALRAQSSYRLLNGVPEALSELKTFVNSPGFVGEVFSGGPVSPVPIQGRAPSSIEVGLLPAVQVEDRLSSRSPLGPSRTNGRRVRRGSPKYADRFRIRYTKADRLRFASHLEVIRALERGFIAARIPLMWSQGKDPRPKMAFGPPLAVGVTSEAEFLDIVLSRETGEAFIERVNICLPEGLSLVQCSPIRNEAASLGSSVDIAAYRVSFPRHIQEDYPSSQNLERRLKDKAQEVLGSDSLLITKIKKEKTLTINARSSILSALVSSDPGGYPALDLRIRLNRPETIRPESLAAHLCGSMEMDERTLCVHRTGLFVTGGQHDLDPMQVIQRDFAWWQESLRSGVTR